MPEFLHDGVTLELPQALATPGLVAKLQGGQYEYDEGQAARRCVKPGFRVLEMGGGIGYVTTICAAQAGAGNVLCVEANPALIPVIEGNLARNGQGEASVLHAAVVPDAPPEAEVGLVIGEGLTNSRLSERRRLQGSVMVPAVGIHDLIAAQRPHVVIMDIEGAEAGLFARKWACPLRFMVLELHPRLYGPEVTRRIFDWASEMEMAYDPGLSRGKTVGFRKIWSTRR